MADSTFLAALLKARSRAWGGSFYSPVQSRQAAEALDSAITSTGFISGNQPIPHGTVFPGSPATNDQFFRTDRGTLNYWDGAAWQTVNPAQKVAFSAWNSTTTTLVTNTAVLIVINNKIYDLGTNFSTSTGLFTAPVKGIYHFSGSWSTVAIVADSLRFQAQLFKNGSTIANGPTIQNGAANTFVAGANVSADIQLAASDTIGLAALASFSVQPNVATTQADTWLTGHLVTTN